MVEMTNLEFFIEISEIRMILLVKYTNKTMYYKFFPFIFVSLLQIL